MEHAYINREVVRWARERSALSREELASVLKVSAKQVSSWETGEQYPPFGKAEDLAKRLRIPFGYLFLSEIPRDQLPIPDRRSLDDRRKPPSPDFLDLLNDVLVRRDWYVEYSKENDAAALPFVGSATTRHFERIVSEIRDAFQINSALRQSANTWSGYLRLLVQSAEANGIIVMRAGVVRGNPRRPLSVSEFRGFVITDRVAPLIFLNAKDAQAAQIFTLAHELVHIWLGQSGISNPDPVSSDEQSVNSDDVELFCNRAAVEILVPALEFDGAWDNIGANIAAKVERLARMFRVSVPVILRRARERNHVSLQVFLDLLTAHRRKVEALEKQKDDESGGNFYNTFWARNSLKLTQAMLSAVRAGSLSTLDAARLLNVKTSTVPKLTERSEH